MAETNITHEKEEKWIQILSENMKGRMLAIWKDNLELHLKIVVVG
jgi:hypothetical protein